MGAEIRGQQLWGKALQVKGFMKNTWLVRYEGPPGVGHWPSSATRGTLYGHDLEDSGWLGDPSPGPHSAHCDYTYILRGQELHAIGYLVAEAHKIRS